MKKVLGITFSTLALAMMVTVSAGAARMRSQEVLVPYDGSLAGAQLPIGTYHVKCETHGQDATLTFLMGKKVVATVEGKLVDRKNKSSSNTVVYTTRSDGSRAIVEIRFAHPNEVVVFNE